MPKPEEQKPEEPHTLDTKLVEGLAVELSKSVADTEKIREELAVLNAELEESVTRTAEYRNLLVEAVTGEKNGN